MTETINQDREFTTTDQGFAAYLMTKFMFLEAVDTGERIGTGKYTKKQLMFLVPKDEDMEEHWYDYKKGTENSVVPAKVMFEKMRLVRQHCRQPFNAKGLDLSGAKT